MHFPISINVGNQEITVYKPPDFLANQLDTVNEYPLKYPQSKRIVTLTNDVSGVVSDEGKLVEIHDAVFDPFLRDIGFTVPMNGRAKFSEHLQQMQGYLRSVPDLAQYANNPFVPTIFKGLKLHIFFYKLSMGMNIPCNNDVHHLNTLIRDNRISNYQLLDHGLHRSITALINTLLNVNLGT